MMELMERMLNDNDDHCEVIFNLIDILKGIFLVDFSSTIVNLYSKIFSTPFVNENEETITNFYCKIIEVGNTMNDSDIQLCSIMMSLVAHYSLPFFLKLVFEDNFSKISCPEILFLSTVRIILDPCSSFLFSIQQANPNILTFFGSSFDKECCDFTIALEKLRTMIFNKAISLLTSQPHMFSEDRSATYIPLSVFRAIQSIIVPPSEVAGSVSSGFTSRPEVVCSISKFIESRVFVKEREVYSQEQPFLIEKWLKLYSMLSSYSIKPQVSSLTFGSINKDDHYVLMYYLKLVLFCNPIQQEPLFELHSRVIINQILSNDIHLSSFLVLWTQYLLFVYPDIAFTIFDEIFYVIDNLEDLISESLHTFILTVTRFVDVLTASCMRYLEEDQIKRLHSLSVIGMCMSNPDIRKASFKLSRILSKFVFDEEPIRLHEMIIVNKGVFAREFLNFFENDPIVRFRDFKYEPLMPLSFDLILNSNDSILWQHIVLLIAKKIYELFPSSFCSILKNNVLKYIQNLFLKGLISKNATIQIDSINVLTFLSVISDTPVKHKDIFLSPSNESLHLLHNFIGKFIDILYRSLSITLMGLHISSFPSFLYILKASFNYRIVALSLRAMAWNPNFFAICQHKEFYELFFELFLMLKNHIENDILEDHLFPQHSYQQSNIISDFISTSFQLFSFIQSQFQRIPNLQFPCCKIVAFVSPEISRNVGSFIPLLYRLVSLSNLNQWSQNQELFLVHSLSTALSISPIPQTNLLLVPVFSDCIDRIAQKDPSILVNLLFHHFEVLYPRYLQKSLSINGGHYFHAIAQFFRSPSLSYETTLGNILLFQWKSCVHQEYDGILHNVMQIVYENCGTLILVCLYCLLSVEKQLADESFILLGSLTPLILQFHISGKNESLSNALAFYLQVSSNFGESVSGMDQNTVQQISSFLSNQFAFCLEQVLSDVFDYVPCFESGTVMKLLSVLIPWFDKVSFDIENRLISSETDSLFIRFSCYSFIDRLIIAFSKLTTDDVNTSLFLVWRSLVISNGQIRDSFVHIMILILTIAEKTENKHVLLSIIKYLYKISPQHVASYLTAFLSFNFAFYRHHHDQQLQSNEKVPDIRALEISSNSTIDLISITEFQYQKFIIQCLIKLSSESIGPLIPFLPTVFTFCLIHFAENYLEIQSLLNIIVLGIRSYIQSDALYHLSEVERLVGSLPNSTENATLNESSFVFHPESGYGTSKLGVIQKKITQVVCSLFFSIDKNIAYQFSLELLRWGLCCGDLKIASNALLCFRGPLLCSGSLIIGLCARSLMNVSQSIRYLCEKGCTNDSSVVPYCLYIHSMLHALKSVAKELLSQRTLSMDPSLFWIAVECLKCNHTWYSKIFISSINLLIFFLENRDLFSVLIGNECRCDNTEFLPGVFWKFHKPWNQEFTGCIFDVLSFESDSVPLHEMIEALNLLVQTKFTLLISNKPNCLYTVTLALLPWFWTNVTTRISRYLFDDPDILIMKNTIQALNEIWSDIYICGLLSSLFEYDNLDLFSVMMKLVVHILENIDDEDLGNVFKFYTNILKYHESVMLMPLYTISNWIITKFRERTNSLQNLHDFVSIAKRDSKDGLRPFALFFVQNIDPSLTQSLNNPNNYSFPELHMFERIVVVNIPHLFGTYSLEDTSTTFDDPNSFPPLLPSDPVLLTSDSFHNLDKFLKMIRCEPFSQYNELLMKMFSSLVGLDSLYKQRLGRLIFDPGFGELLIQFSSLASSGNIILSPSVLSNEAETNNEFEIADISIGDPYSLIFIYPQIFVPTVDEVNLVGGNETTEYTTTENSYINNAQIGYNYQ